ncbi:MAG: HlyD family efflux transporter periplasmic adaptor subunit [Mastigocoleus sp.]
MKHSIVANAAQARQTKQKFAKPEDQLSYELGKAVQELPPLYTRTLAGTISIIIFGAIAWANFSKIDEVATAPGELIASTQVRPITSIGEGSIVKVTVKEGEVVEKDQVLVKRDPDIKQTEAARLDRSAKLIKEDLARLQAERRGEKLAGTKLQNELLKSRLQDYQSQQAAAEAEANRQKALIKQAQVRLRRLQENLKNAKISLKDSAISYDNSQKVRQKIGKSQQIATQREESLRTLFSDGAFPRLDYLDAQERLNRASTEITRANDQIVTAKNRVTQAQDRVASLEKDVAAQAQEILQAEQAYQAAKNQAQRLISQRQSEILTEIGKRKEELTNISGQLELAKKRENSEIIKAPVAGTVYSIKATKGPVQSGEELLSILPEGEELMLQVKVRNRDVGFVRKGMRAKVKLATFPFQEFGTIDGEVAEISPNAIVDKDLGLVFPTRIKLSKYSVMVRGQEVAFTPGMTASGEIVTRKKSILTFLVEPITRRFSEAFSVR